MRKKLIIISVLCAIIFAAVVGINVFIHDTTGNECNTAEKNAIRVTIEKAIRIKYGWASKHKLRDISTKDFLDKIYKDGFYKGLAFYKIDDKNFMDTYHKGKQNTATVYVRIYDPDITILIFTLTKTKNGENLITDIEYDT